MGLTKQHPLNSVYNFRRKQIGTVNAHTAMWLGFMKGYTNP